jgi:hypothetical protein
MATKKADKPAISPERVEEIRADARSGRNWAAEHTYGPACVCGAFLDGSTVTSWGFLIQKGWCHRHGTSQGSRIARHQ